MQITIEGTVEQVRDGCLWIAFALEPQDQTFLMLRRAHNIETRRANKERHKRITADRKLVHAAFLVARKSGDPRMRDLLDALTGKTELAATVPMAQAVLDTREQQ